METETNFSFEGKKVTVIGGKGKMGSAFSQGMEHAGAMVSIVDRDTEPLGETPETDMLLFAVNELTTVNLLRKLNQEILGSIPIITTSSTNQLLHTWILTDRIAKGAHFHGHKQLKHLVPIHTLSGPKMEGAVMIDCTEGKTLERTVSSEIARIMKMEQEFVPLEVHDCEIALGQAGFHRRVWNSIRNTPNLHAWARQLPISQRRAAIGELRVLIRPDISAELITAFGGNIVEEQWGSGAHIERPWCPLSSRLFNDLLIHSNTTALKNIIEKKDPDGLIRDWARTENTRMDQGVGGGPRSFQEFLRSR